MAISKIPGAGVSADTLEAGDIAANAIGASELADNAVDTAAIATNAVTATEIAADAVGESELSVDYTTVKPHIQPGVLYPAYKGTLIDTADPVAASTPEDKSDAAMAITSIDNYTIGTDDPKNGLAYLKTNTTTGSGGSNLTIGDDNDADFQFGTGAFTIEYWVKETDYNYGDHGHMSTSQGAVGWAINLSGEYIYFTAQGDAFGSAPTSGNKIIARANRSGHVSDGTWYHVAIVRVSTSNLKIYINGTDRTAEADAGGTYGWGWDNTSNDHNLVLGRAYPAADEKHTVGGFDDLRITKGLAVYTGNFTAPTSTLTKTWSAGTNIAANSTASNVKLLMTSESGGLPNHSGAYGTAQSDGKKYYYTDIKGSKPIKDPRIGAHFGSQRHTISSLQLLEQETATNGSNVYSVDGREWCRASGNNWTIANAGTGVRLIASTNSGIANTFVEVTGYFNDINFSIIGIWTDNDRLTISLNGGTVQANDFNTSVSDPKGGRYVAAASYFNPTFNSTPTLGINTVKIYAPSGFYATLGSIELIAQDTSNVNNIQIPSQNVVSYGKKFTVSGTPHYDPFNGMSGAKTLAQLGDYIDTATSLGMDNWKGGTSNYYKPFNGGRVVKWVDSSGTIKTSVNMMPPNAQNISTTASNAVSDAHIQAGTNDDTINFNTSAIDNSLSEVAKLFYMREFGNGAANQGNNTSGTLQDFSMANAVDDWAYVMDDGLTSASSTHHRFSSMTEGLHRNSGSGKFYHTFIGTGIGRRTGTAVAGGYHTFAQNLPYGTHIFAHIMDSGGENSKWYVDGIEVYDNSSGSSTWHNVGESLHIQQPKKPPIPEDAVVLADYMLMADFVPVSGTANYNNISKGVRWQSSSRDVFADESDGDSMTLDHYVHAGYDGFHLTMSGTADSDTSVGVRLPFFGTNWVSLGYQHDTRFKLYEGAGLSSTDKDSASTKNNDTNEHSYAYLTSNLDLGTYVAGVNCVSGQTFSWYGFQIVSPIHTSSHYQPFETPYLHELVGGDRNMEQTNLVVTPDGKTWDEVTRDTSYLGNLVAYMTTNTAFADSVTVIFDDWRGTQTPAAGPMFNKHFAIAYDRLICLTDGQYTIWAQTIARVSGTTEATPHIFVNGTIRSRGYTSGSNHSQAGISHTEQLKRGDYVQIKGGWYVDTRYSNAHIIKLS